MFAKTISIALLAAMAAASVATSAAAQSNGLVMIAYHDLDLNSASGARVMLRRIESAADRICASPDAVAGQTREQCVAATVDLAVNRFGNKAVAAAYKASLAPAPVMIAAAH